jgi:hypothetical protein
VQANMREQAFTAVDAWTIGHLIVIAGPRASGKSHFIRLLRSDETLRERLGVARNAPALTAGAFLNLPVVGSIDQLVLHYDILRPLKIGFPSHELDPGTAVLRRSGSITFCTLRVPRERLSAQLEERIARRKNPPKDLRKLRSLYADEEWLDSWYARWHAFVQQFSAVMAGAYLVDMLGADPPYSVALERVGQGTTQVVNGLESSGPA